MMQSITKHALIAFVLRIGLILFSYYQDSNYVVKYTDIDYNVYSDAAEYLYNGQSPFNRHTYRYTPLLAVILCLNILVHSAFGKLVFAAFDVTSGILIWKILQNYKCSHKVAKLCTLICLYNPLFAVISTRGSSDSIITVLVLLSILFVQKKQIVLLGLTYGFSVHFRIYPCIYALSFYSVLSNEFCGSAKICSKLINMLKPNIAKINFILCTSIGFFLPSVLSYYFYGVQYIDETFLYHLTRKDIRHNFSPYFYFLYLSEGQEGKSLSFISLLPFVFQFVLLLITAWIYGTEQTLPIGLFVQTAIFVTFNKVSTSQYFLWYICLLPLIIPLLNISTKGFSWMLVFWISGQVLWLFTAYLLEFEGRNVFFWIWLSSLAMFSINTYLLYFICTKIKLIHFKTA